MPLSPEQRLPGVSTDRQGLVTTALALLTDVADDLQSGWGGGAMTPVPYDTAWVAMVRHPEQPAQLAFPEALTWLLSHQAADGSWGRTYPHTLLPTMAGLLALRRAPTGPAAHESAIAAATAYLQGALATWSPDRHESVGFEVVAPFLLAELADLGLTFDFRAQSALMALYREKLLISGPELLYSGKSNLIHSLEAFGTTLDFERLKAQQAANGSYGCSPAATAATLIYGPAWDPKAAEWLQQLSERAFGGGPGGMPNAYPIDAFETSWVLCNLGHGGLAASEIPVPLRARLSEWLHGCLTPAGASITRTIGLPADSDDTGMVLTALHQLGDEAAVATLLPFERESHFACFHLERGASMSANAHVLAALRSLPAEARAAMAPQIAKATAFLYEIRDPAGFWQDKWHVSPYYATASAVLALAADDERLRPSVSWVLDTQRADGGWGHGTESTLEETAYALQVLQAAETGWAPPAELARQRGLAALQARFDVAYPDGGGDLPPLWLGKEVYTPIRVVFAAALGVLLHGATDQSAHRNRR